MNVAGEGFAGSRPCHANANVFSISIRSSNNPKCIRTYCSERERVRNVPRTTRNANVAQDVEIKCEKDSRGAYRTEQMNDTSPKCKIK